MTHLEFLLNAERLMPTGLHHVRHLTVLMRLAEERKPMKSRDLAEAIRMPKPSICRITDALASEGLITKGHDRRAGGDGRDCWIGLTEKGRYLAAHVQGQALQLQAEAA